MERIDRTVGTGISSTAYNGILCLGTVVWDVSRHTILEILGICRSLNILDSQRTCVLIRRYNDRNTCEAHLIEPFAMNGGYRHVSTWKHHCYK